jgi:molybdate transport system permease protein
MSASSGTAEGAGTRARRPPVPIALLAAIGAVFLCLPIVALVVGAPWSRLVEVVTSPVVRDALVLSLGTSTVAAALSVVFGVPLAWVLARTEFVGRAVLRGVVALPIVLPPVVGGVALLAALGRRGVLGGFLESRFGVVLPFSTAGVVVAQTFVAMPFLVVTVEAALRTRRVGDEDAAVVLGASRWRTFREVTLPATAPAIVAGVVLAWARALGEFGATVTFAGNLQGRTQTLPLAIYLGLDVDAGAATVMSLVLVAVSLAVLIGLRSRWLPELVRR